MKPAPFTSARPARQSSEHPVAGAKQSFVTRRMPPDDCTGLTLAGSPSAGDLVLARVESIAQHTRVQLSSGRRSELYVGDHLVLSYANRYAPDQFEACVPCDLQPCHLITAGGVAARMVSKHARLKAPTVIQPLGLLTGADGRVLNLRRYGLSAAGLPGATRKPVIGVLGTAMNAGKTTAAAALVRGLKLAGLRVAAIKATGTGSGNDLWALEDAGATLALDFTDAGYPSTYKVPAEEIERLLDRLVTHALQSGVDAVVVEIADGLLHQETASLVQSRTFNDHVDQVVFCAGDALGAHAGVEWLETRGVCVAAVSGALTASPLAIREAYHATRLQVLTREQLSDPAQASSLLGHRA